MDIGIPSKGIEHSQSVTGKVGHGRPFLVAVFTTRDATVIIPGNMMMFSEGLYLGLPYVCTHGKTNNEKDPRTLPNMAVTDTG